MNTAITAQRVTAYYVTDADGNHWTDENGYGWFAKDIARAHARALGGMYYNGNKISVKEVVTGYEAQA